MIEELLSGSHVRLWPYARGLYDRDVLYALWRYVEDQGAADRLFHAQQADKKVRGDLVQFVTYLENKPLLIAQSLKDEQIAGFCWFDDVLPDYRASFNVFMRRRYWGVCTQETIDIGCRYGFEGLNFQDLWAYTPWDDVVRTAKRAGFAFIATLPGFGRLDGRPLDIHVLKRGRA